MNVIPFLPEFHEKVRDGRKTATARSKAYGMPGDRLQGPGCVLVLDSVERKALREVAEFNFIPEGLSSPEEFKAIWNRIHPRKGYDPSAIVWFHRFHVEAPDDHCTCGCGCGLPADDGKCRSCRAGEHTDPQRNQEAGQ